MLSDQITCAEDVSIMTKNKRIYRQYEYALSLPFNHNSQDWRELIMLIQISRLMIGGESIVAPAVSKCCIPSQIPNSLWKIFPTGAGGHQYTFYFKVQS